jgi:FMN phosphatase YigB (HAD superfamily)
MWAEDVMNDAAVGGSSAAQAGVSNPVRPGGRIRAVLFDLDGTLYRQRPVRGRMMLELAGLALTHPRQAPRSWRALAEFRRAQETLRDGPRLQATPGMQLSVAAERAGMTAQEVDAIVTEWMVDRPLKYLASCRASGLLELLAFLDRRHIEVGVLSDYPADLKLKALGLDGRFSLVLSASDPQIGVFKPHPKGFLVACERWRLDPEDVLVVGDRADVDAAGATAAGMPCAIIGTSRHSSSDQDVLFFPSLERLHDVLDHHHSDR